MPRSACLRCCHLAAGTSALGVLLVLSTFLPSGAASGANPEVKKHASTCQMHMTGSPSGGIADATLSCEGGEITASMNATALGPFKAGFKGVSWDPGSCGGSTCLFTVCGSSSVLFVNSSITGITDRDLINGTACFCAAEESSLTFSHAVLSGNAGSALCMKGNASCNITDETVVSDHEHSFESALAASGDSRLVSGATNVSNNSAGGLSVRENAEVTISGSFFVLNSADEGGGFLAQNHSLVIVTEGTVFDSCSSSHDGGAFKADGFASLSISYGVVFRASHASGAGGGFLAGGNSSLTVTKNVSFESCSTDWAGGGGNIEKEARVEISKGVMFYNRTSGVVGGALSVFDSASLSVHDGVVIDSNTATDVGGGMGAFGNSSMTICCNVYVTNNRCEGGSTKVLGSGGGLGAAERASIIVTNGTVIANNFAILRGGGLVGRNQARLIVSGNVTFSNNSADLGGGMSLSEATTASLSRGVFFANTTASSAGVDIQAGAYSVLDIADDSNINAYSTKVLWYRKKRVLGEVNKVGYCQPCAPRTYGLDPLFAVCTMCPANANCSGRTDITPLAGFWHSSNYSAQIHSCPRQEVCL